MSDSDNTIGSVKRVFQIIEALNTEQWKGVSELAEELDLPKSSVYSYLNTLKEQGYVTGKTGQYRLSLQFLKLGERTRRQREIFKYAKPKLDELAEETGELMNLAIEERFEGVYLYLAPGPNAITVDTYPGVRVPLYCTALGKVSLAFIEDSRREEYIAQCDFEPLTENTITDASRFREELEQIRDRGYALDREERSKDIRCIAVPIVLNDEYKGSISITAPVARMQSERFTNELPQMLLDKASVIQINMTYS